MKKMQCFYLLKKLLITDSVPEIGFSCIIYAILIGDDWKSPWKH